MSRRRIPTALPAVDNISSLPEAVLCHILSFLSTKEAVATSVLSKRWINLWLSVDTINFADIQIHSTESNYTFNEFVYSVLVSRDAAAGGFHHISSFCLKIVYSNSHLCRLGLPSIIKWVNLVIQRKLKHLILHLHLRVNDDDVDDPRLNVIPKLPLSVLTCKTLVSLDLEGFAVQGFSNSFIGIGFPSLKTLFLTEIFNFTIRDLVLFLSACPILEYLKLCHIYFYGQEDSLTIPEFKSLTLPKLIKAEIRLCRSSCFPVKALSNSKSLCIHTLLLNKKDCKVYQVNQPQCPSDNVTIFHNLTHLELYGSLNMAAQVLQQCPKLLKLMLVKRESREKEEDDQKNWVEPEFVPQCLLSSLRICIIVSISDLPRDFLFAKYILRNAKVLRFMTVSSKGGRSEIERKLSPCPKASATCRLRVY